MALPRLAFEEWLVAALLAIVVLGVAAVRAAARRRKLEHVATLDKPPVLVGLRWIKWGAAATFCSAVASGGLLMGRWLWNDDEPVTAFAAWAVAGYAALNLAGLGYLGRRAEREHHALTLDDEALHHCTLPPLPWHRVSAVQLLRVKDGDGNVGGWNLELAADAAWRAHAGAMAELARFLWGLPKLAGSRVVIPLGFIDHDCNALARQIERVWKANRNRLAKEAR